MDLEKLIVGNAAGTARDIEHVRLLENTAVTRITIGSITKEARKGNRAQTYNFDPNTNSSVNSIGIKNEGMEWYHAAGKIHRMSQIAHDAGKKLWVSVAGFSTSEFAELSETAFLCGADGVELNLGCPNIHDGGKSKPIYSYRPEMVEAVLDEMAMFAFQNKQIGVKISPVPDELIEPLAKIIRRSTVVTEIVAVNTLPGQVVAFEDGPYALNYYPQDSDELRHDGGLAGAPLKVHGLRVVRMLKEFLPSMPIIGVGGIFTGADAKEYLDAGATGFECGTSYYNFENPRIFSDILNELVSLTEDP